MLSQKRFTFFFCFLLYLFFSFWYFSFFFSFKLCACKIGPSILLIDHRTNNIHFLSLFSSSFFLSFFHFHSHSFSFFLSLCLARYKKIKWKTDTRATWINYSHRNWIHIKFLDSNITIIKCCPSVSFKSSFLSLI